MLTSYNCTKQLIRMYVYMIMIVFILIGCASHQNPTVRTELDQAKLNVSTYTQYLSNINKALAEAREKTKDPAQIQQLDQADAILIDATDILMGYTGIVKAWEKTSVKPFDLDDRELRIENSINTLLAILASLKEVITYEQ